MSRKYMKILKEVVLYVGDKTNMILKIILLAMAILYLLISSLRYKSEYIKLINYNYKQAHRLAEKDILNYLIWTMLIMISINL